MHPYFSRVRCVQRAASVALALLTVALLTFSLASGTHAAGLTTVATFTGGGAGTNGWNPLTGVTFDSSGNMFGTTNEGGPGGAGTIWEIAHGTTTITDLVTLYTYSHGNFSADASGPMGVTLDAAGNLYGTTSGSPTSVYGGVYKLPHGSSTLTTLYSFANTPDGNGPTAGVTFDAAGNMYGTTQYGGSGTGLGTIWEITAGGTVRSPIASFPDTPGGSEPAAGVTIDSSGNLYGTTAYGGTTGDGTVWELPHGSTTIVTLASFNSSVNGNSPSARVTLDSSGNLYGTAYGGGTNEAGTVWKIAHGTNTLTVIAQFAGSGIQGSTLGLKPNSSVTIDGAGNFFGTTSEGGTADSGTVWEIAHGTNTITTLASFVGTLTAGDPNGCFPTGGVTIDSKGNLFGTSAGGIDQAGIVWELAGVAVPVVGTTLPVPTVLTLTPNPAHSDVTLNGLVTLSQTVTADTPVAITKGSTALGSATVLAGTNSVSFTLGTSGIRAGTYTFGATLNGVSVTQAVTFTTDTTKPVPVSIVFTPSPVLPNTATTGTVTLSAPAPTGGLNVELYVNGTDLGYVTFPAGTSVETFGQTLAAGTYTYTAIENGVSVSTTLSVTTPVAAASAHILWTNTNGTASLWNYSTTNGTFTSFNFGPYAGWNAKAIADGGTDGKTRLLWANTNGTAALWNVASDTGAFTASNFGPYTGWTAKTVSVGSDNTTHMLWTNANGTAALWNVVGGVYQTEHDFGPYAGWTAQSLADGSDGKTRLLWTNTNGQAAFWNVTPTTGSFTQFSFGPYAGWTAKAVSASATTTHILWTNTNGTAAVWNYSPSTGSFTQKAYGPYSGWSANGLADGSDGKVRLLWNNTSGTAAVWSVDNGTGLFSQFSFGPYSGWTATGISAQ